MARKINRLIYGLIDPTTKQLRYIGKSTYGLSRPRCHSCKYCLSYKTHNANWVRSLVNKGLKPEIAVIEEPLDACELNEAEFFWIAYFRSIGCKLTNLTTGGEGSPGAKKSNQEKLAMAERKRGHRPSEAQMAALIQHANSQSNKEHCHKMLEIHRHKALAPEAIAKRAAKKRGTQQTLDSRIRISRSKGGKAIVDQYGTVYECINIACEKLGLDQSAVWGCLNGKRISVKSFKFRYIDGDFAKPSNHNAKARKSIVDNNGNVYPSILAASKTLGISRIAIWGSLKRGDCVKGCTSRYLDTPNSQDSGQ